MRRRLRRWRRKWLPRAPRWRQPFCPSVSASVGGPEQRMVQAADGTPIGRPLFKDRLAIVVLCAPIRALLGDKAFGLSLQVAFDTIIPTKHPYIAVFSKPRPVGRRRGATDIVVKQTDVGNPDSSAGADDGLHPGLPRAPALPEGSAIPVRPRGRRGRAGGGNQESCRRPVASPRRRGKAYPSSGRLRADRRGFQARRSVPGGRQA